MAGFLATFVAAHAIGHNCQPPFAEKLLIILRLPIAEGILVVLALAADIGLTRDFDSGTNFHQSVCGADRVHGTGKTRMQAKRMIIKAEGRSAQTATWDGRAYSHRIPLSRLKCVVRNAGPTGGPKTKRAHANDAMQTLGAAESHRSLFPASTIEPHAYG